MKRKRSDSDDEHIRRKIKKLERKLNRGRRSKRRHDHSDDSAHTPPRRSSRSRSIPEDIEPLEAIDLVVEENPSDVNTTVCPVSDTIVGPVEPAHAPDLDEIALQILGDDPPTNEMVYGKEIQKDLAVRFAHTATNGLTKESKKALKEKYLTPSNCTLIEPPILNEEIKAALTDVVVKRDRAIEIKQSQLTTALSCLGEAISILLPKQDKDQELLRLLMDASRMLCDRQYEDSVTRKNFLLFQLKKDMKTQLEKTKMDKYLFGEKLSETIKSAKAIQKSSTDLRPTSAPKPVIKKNAPSLPARQQHLNYRAPPPRRPLGGQRTKEPATAPPPPLPPQARYRHPMTSSRPSQPRPNYNRR